MTPYIAGFSGLLSTGKGGTLEIAGKIDGAAHYASSSGYADWKEVFQDIVKKKPEFVALFGHSNGGYAVLKIAQALDAIGIEVDYLGIIDLTLKPSPPVYGNVKFVQEFHSAFARAKFHETFKGKHDLYELDEIMNGNIGHSEAATLDFTQNKIVETIASLTKGKPVSKDKFYIGEGKRISDKDFAVLSAKHQIPQYLLRAVVEVEARQKGSHSSGALVFRYELHKAYQYSDGAVRDTLVNAGLASPSYKVALNWSHANSYPHLEQAAMIAGEELACLASSWGMGQIMGFNHRALGFDTALDMVTNFAQSEANQAEGMVAFIKDAGLLDDLLAENWKNFAAGYNGKSYADNKYDVKLWQAAEKWKRQIGSDIDVITIPVPTDPNPTKPPVIDNLGSLDGVRTTLAQHFPALNEQNRELVLALATLLGGAHTSLPAVKETQPAETPAIGSGSILAGVIKGISRIPEEIQQQKLPTNPPTEAGFLIPENKGIEMLKTTLNFKSKTFWTGAAMAAAGILQFIMPEGSVFIDLATSVFGATDPGILIANGLAVIFGREAIEKLAK